MSKKDYTANWDSEMHEEFAFWGFSDWKAALQTAGFYVIENPNEPRDGFPCLHECLDCGEPLARQSGAV